MKTMPVIPLAPARGRVRVGAVDLAYDVRGTGEPLLLIPGLSMRRTMWPEELCDALAAAGFHVVRMDNRDSGDSARVDARAPDVMAVLGRSLLGLAVEVPYRLEDMAEDAVGLMRALGHETFHVAGASMGGMIAQTIAIMRPGALRSLASVMSGPGGRRYAVAKPSALRAVLTPVPAEREAQIERLVMVFRLLNGGVLPFDEAAARALAIAQVDGGTEPPASARHLGAIIESSGRRRALLHKVTTPTLVIHGSHDPLLPLRGARATARAIPGAELLVVEGMGHDLSAPVLPLIAGAIATHARKAAHVTPPAGPRTLDLPRASRAFRTLLRDPDDLPQVFEIIEALSTERHARRLHAGFQKTELGRRLLERKPDIVRILADRERLRAMPEGSLGRAYLAFVERENISAQGIREASLTADRLARQQAELAFVGDRMRDTHDLWHAVTGYHGDVLGEVGLLAFTLAQHWNPGIALIVAGALVKGTGGQVSVASFVRDGYRRGRAAAWLPAQDWEALLERPLDEVRATLGLGAPPAYTPVRTAELRELGVI
ncbi:MAG: Coq4 family protein [Kofleriaceae bacterium]|nr:Coq4 family protein [Kofleriaceae bacterium]